MILNAAPEADVPIKPVGPEQLGIFWELTGLTTSVTSIVTVAAACFIGGLILLGVAKFLRQLVPKVGGLLAWLATATTVFLVIMGSTFIYSWFSDSAIADTTMYAHADEVRVWLQSNGYPSVTPAQSVELVCEYHYDKSAVCGESVGGTMVNGFARQIVIRSDDDGLYHVVDAFEAGAVTL